VSVVLTLVRTVGEAEVIAALLRTEGIPFAYPQPPEYDGQAEIFGYAIRVAETDYERARELIEAGESWE
jgi:Putative prokaryotic signal transducing protein